MKSENYFYGGKKKMARKSVLFFAALISVVFIACKTVPKEEKILITQKDRERLRTEENLKGVQYYVDEEILLSREDPIVIEGGPVTVDTSGKVFIRDGKKITEIVISKETRGELLGIRIVSIEGVLVECLGIGFEKDNDVQILWFRPGRWRNGSVEGYYLVNLDAPAGKYKYGDREDDSDIYNLQITGGSSRWPYLLGIINEDYILQSERRTAEGRVVGGR